MQSIASVIGGVLAVVPSAGLFVIVVAAPAHAKATPSQKCAAAKEKATAKKAAAKITCYRKTNLVVPADPVCLQKAEDKFAKAFAKAEKPGACDVTGDADGIEAQVDTFVSALVQALQPAARAQPSPELKCALDKITAAKNYDTQLVNCYAASLSASSQGLLANCVMKAQDTFDHACTKAEAQIACNTTCDAIKNLVNMFVTGATQTLVPPTPTATVTRTPTPTPRFIDNGNGTITDTQTKLMWEKKDRSGTVLHDKDSPWEWAGRCSVSNALCQTTDVSSSSCTAQTGGALGCAKCGPGEGSCIVSIGTPLWSVPTTLNSFNFAGHRDWRLPTDAELQTILDTNAPGCTEPPSLPCVPAAFNKNCIPGCTVTTCSCTAINEYWSATTFSGDPQGARYVDFGFGFANFYSKDNAFRVRAVR